MTTYSVVSNPLCEGTNCTKPFGAIRLVPLDDTTIVRMCATCYVTEMDYNDGLETRILPKIPFSLFPLFTPTQDDWNRVLAEADEYPAQRITRIVPFKELPKVKLEVVV